MYVTESDYLDKTSKKTCSYSDVYGTESDCFLANCKEDMCVIIVIVYMEQSLTIFWQNAKKT